MFVESESDLKQFVGNLLQAKWPQQVNHILLNEDHKQLRYANLKMQQKMPRQLISKKYEYAVPNSKLQQRTESLFPKMFSEANKKVYEYVNENVQNMRNISTKYDRIHSIRTQNNEDLVRLQMPIEKQIETQQLKTITQIPKAQIDIAAPIVSQVKSNQKKSQKFFNKSYSLSRPSKHQQNNFIYENSSINPFISKNLNFTDQFANSKSLTTKNPFINFNQSSRNIAAIAQSGKSNAFSSTMAFPTSVMPGTILAPRDSSFSKQTKLDVGDVMRYTLGVKRESRQGNQFVNPFQRPPKKRGE